MKVLKIFSYIMAFAALIYYGYQYFGNPNGKTYTVTKNQHVYYKGDGVTKDDAKKVGDYLKQAGYFTNDNGVDVQIFSNRPDSKVKISYVVDNDKITSEIEKDFLLISSGLSEKVFNNRKILVSLADDKLDEIKSLGFATPLQQTPFRGSTDSSENK